MIGKASIIYNQSIKDDAKRQINGSDNLIDLVSCEVNNNKLTVKIIDDIDIVYGKKGKLEIITSSPIINTISVNGDGMICIKNKIKSSDFTINLSGSGTINGQDIECDEMFSINLDGSGDVIVRNIKT